MRPPALKRDGVILLLSLASGGMDALSFLALGVFTSAMTGNAALFGLALGQSRMSNASRSALAFAGFAAGVALASAMPSRPRLVLFAEAALLGAFAALWPQRVPAIYAPIALSQAFLPELILLAGVAMGMQSRTARRLNAPGVNTVVFTSTLTEIVGALTDAALGRAPRRIRPQTWRQIGAFVSYVAGAGCLGALAVADFKLAAIPALACVLLAATLV